MTSWKPSKKWRQTFKEKHTQAVCLHLLSYSSQKIWQSVFVFVFTFLFLVLGFILEASQTSFNVVVNLSPYLVAVFHVTDQNGDRLTVWGSKGQTIAKSPNQSLKPSSHPMRVLNYTKLFQRMEAIFINFLYWIKLSLQGMKQGSQFP